MAQTTYNIAPDEAFAGMPGGSFQQSLSRANETGAGVEMGIAVREGSTEGTFQRMSATAQVVLGVTAIEHDKVDPDLTGDLSIPDDGMAKIQTQGLVWVRIDQDVSVGDPVYVRHTAAGAEVAGIFRMDADTADADLLAGAVWVKGGTVAGTGIALVNLNLPS